MNPTLSPADYQAIHEFLESRAGIRLGEGKEYLVTSRLSRLLSSLGMSDFSQLVERLAASALENDPLRALVVDEMTTNETFWFRDASHYPAMIRGVLLNRAPSRLRIWSAASSTGQEAYSISMVLRDGMREGDLPADVSYDIIGTDISPTAVEEAKRAIYCGVASGRGLDSEQRRRYFRAHDDCIEVLPQYRKGISFRTFNLLESFDTLGRFDIVFCRNVLIYFSRERKQDILKRMAAVLNPGGYLFLGSTESIGDAAQLFEMRSLAGGLVYQLRE